MFTRRASGCRPGRALGAIAASDPADEGPFFEPAEGKVYRHPTFYRVPDEVGHM